MDNITLIRLLKYRHLYLLAISFLNFTLGSITTASMSLLIAPNIIRTPHKKNQDSTCGRDNIPNIDVASSAFNLISYLVFPLIQRSNICRLQLSLRKRVGVSVISSIDLLACTAAVVRLAFSVIATIADNFTYTFSHVSLSASAESVCHIGHVHAFLPTGAHIDLTRRLSWLRTTTNQCRDIVGRPKQGSERSRQGLNMLPGEACPYIEIQDNSLALSILNPTSALKDGLTT